MPATRSQLQPPTHPMPLDPEVQSLISGMQAQIASLTSQLAAKLDKATFDGFAIKPGQRVTVSGTGSNQTISANDQNSNGADGSGSSGGGGGGGGSGGGWTGSITVCFDDGMGGFTQGTADFVNGILQEVG